MEKKPITANFWIYPPAMYSSPKGPELNPSMDFFPNKSTPTKCWNITSVATNVANIKKERKVFSKLSSFFKIIHLKTNKNNKYLKNKTAFNKYPFSLFINISIKVENKINKKKITIKIKGIFFLNLKSSVL